jgi:methionyl-tRNA formyltransferase
MRVLFFGTPEFAVPSLTALVGEGFDVVGVVTRPDKATGRHRSTLVPSPVKRAALAEELPVFEPERPSSDEFIAQARALQPDIAVVVAYGHILKTALLDVPTLGSWNVHASLLPKLRGAAPIERAILEGHSETGVSIMRMDAGMDTGPVLHVARTPIPPGETGGELRMRLAEVGAMALIEALVLLDESSARPVAQNDADASYAPKLTREEERIDWTQPAEAIARKIRAFDPTPGAWTSAGGKSVKLFGPRVLDEDGRRGTVDGGPSDTSVPSTVHSPLSTPPGTVLAAGDQLRIACGVGAVEVCDLQPAGKGRMTVKSFVNGRGVAVGDVLS